MEPFNLNMSDIKNIVIFNDELKKFLYDIIDTITYFIDEEPTFDAITINFTYNNYIICC